MTENNGEIVGNKTTEKCTICKEIIENRAILESCFHSYCFPCIVGWSFDPKNRCLCPRCDKPFQNILHNIKDDTNFDTYTVPEIDYELEPKVEIPIETECSICFENFEDRAAVETCLHNFCFKCIVDWAKVRKLCPICNGPINLIYHNVQEDLTFEEYDVTKTEEIKVVNEPVQRVANNSPIYYPTAYNQQDEPIQTNNQVNRVVPQPVIVADNRATYELPAINHQSGSLVNAVRTWQNDVLPSTSARANRIDNPSWTDKDDDDIRIGMKRKSSDHDDCVLRKRR